MAKDETRGAREEGRRQSRGAAETAENVPLVSAKRGKFETLEKAKVEALVFARLTDYKAFVAEMEGEEPEDGAVISTGLEMLFEADKGFERWVAERRKRSRHGALTASGSGTGNTRGDVLAAAATGAVTGQEKNRRAES